MSRQNKVNPGMYTQRGRLTQDDAAREIAKQRSVGSEHTWQPVQRGQEPRMPPDSEGDEEDAGIAAPVETEKTPARVIAKPGSAKKKAVRKSAKPSVKSARGKAKKTAAPPMRGKAKSGRTMKAKGKSAKRR